MPLVGLVEQDRSDLFPRSLQDPFPFFVCGCVLDNLRAAQSVIGLARRFGTQRHEAACHRALTFDDPKYCAVKTIPEYDRDPISHLSA